MCQVHIPKVCPDQHQPIQSSPMHLVHYHSKFQRNTVDTMWKFHREWHLEITSEFVFNTSDRAFCKAFFKNRVHWTHHVKTELCRCSRYLVQTKWTSNLTESLKWNVIVISLVWSYSNWSFFLSGIDSYEEHNFSMKTSRCVEAELWTSLVIKNSFVFSKCAFCPISK